MEMSKRAGKDSTPKHFDCLCFDTENSCAFGNEPERLAMILRGNTQLFSSESSSSSESDQTTIGDKNRGFTLKISRIPGLSNLDYTSVFFLETIASTEFAKESLDEFRVNLIEYLVGQGFQKTYITRDDYSQELLSRLYPKFYRLENLLRSYITKHFSISEGVSSWLIHIIDGDTQYKVNQRKNNENVFSKVVANEHIVDTRIFLTDFEDLGKVIYHNSYGNLTSTDLIDRIQTTEDLNVLKESVRANIERYFEPFKEIAFQAKWEFLRGIRHKVAHNSLIRFEDYSTASTYLDELVTFLKDQDEKKIGITTLNEEYIDIEKRPHFRSSSSYTYKAISRNELLTELGSYEKWSKSIGREFLGLKNFLYNRLAPRGYDIQKSWERLEELEHEGLISLDTWTDPDGIFPDQKQISIKRQLPLFQT